MEKRVGVGVAAVVLVAAGFGVGWLVRGQAGTHRPTPGESGKASQEQASPEAADRKGDFEGWKYPGAKELGSGQGAGGYHAMLATTAGLDEVVAFYEKKTGEKLKPDAPGGHGIGGETGTGGSIAEARVFQDDSIQPGAKSEPRPVVVRVLGKRANSYDLTLVISRAKGEDQTHVALTYFPK